MVSAGRGGNRVVTLMLGYIYVSVNFEDEDLDRPVGEIAEEIMGLVKAEYRNLIEKTEGAVLQAGEASR